MTGVSNVIGIDRSIEVTPAVSASSAYTAGDQVGGIQQLSSVFPDFQRSVNPVSKAGGSGSKFPGHVILQTITVTDLGEQDAAFELFFFNELPTVASSDNAALSIVDSEAHKCIGHYSFAPTYGSTGEFSVGSVANINLMLPQQADFDNLDLWVVVSTPGTPTFASTSDLVFKYNFFVD